MVMLCNSRMLSDESPYFLLGYSKLFTLKLITHTVFYQFIYMMFIFLGHINQ